MCNPTRNGLPPMLFDQWVVLAVAMLHTTQASSPVSAHKPTALTRIDEKKKRSETVHAASWPKGRYEPAGRGKANKPFRRELEGAIICGLSGLKIVPRRRQGGKRRRWYRVPRRKVPMTTSTHRTSLRNRFLGTIDRCIEGEGHTMNATKPPQKILWARSQKGLLDR